MAKKNIEEEMYKNKYKLLIIKFRPIKTTYIIMFKIL